jgi:hypothetical protein
MAAMILLEGDAGFAVQLTTRQWQVVDAVVDNEVNTRAEEGDERFVAVGLSVREAGWDQVTGETRTWPPDEQIVTVTLSLEQWGLVVSSLDILTSIQINDTTGDDAEAPRTLREVIFHPGGQAASRMADAGPDVPERYAGPLVPQLSVVAGTPVPSAWPSGAPMFQDVEDPRR